MTHAAVATPRVYVISNSRVVARIMFSRDWQMPASASRQLVILQTLHDMRGLRPPEPDATIWLAPDAFYLAMCGDMVADARSHGWLVRPHWQHPQYVGNFNGSRPV